MEKERVSRVLGFLVKCSGVSGEANSNISTPRSLQTPRADDDTRGLPARRYMLYVYSRIWFVQPLGVVYSPMFRGVWMEPFGFLGDIYSFAPPELVRYL